MGHAEGRATKVKPGRPAPLGATFDGRGVNFAVFSEHATGMDLCLFDERGIETRVPLPRKTAHVFHGYVEGLVPGQRYGFRAHGAYEPDAGFRFNPHKLLVDPYARAIAGKIDYREPVFGYVGAPHVGMAGTVLKPDDREIDVRDSARGIPKGVVVDDRFDWEDDAPPRVPWEDTILYEAHVRSLSMRHPGVEDGERGTYLGLASPAIIDHLKRLGITTVELLPVHEAMDEWPIVARGHKNYWGYSTLGFFAPDQRFASRAGQQVVEFKQMVKALHRAGIEVVLDVVYNHTCESDHLGPTVSLRGLDNTTYYRLKVDNRAQYEDYTGCGNSLNMLHPQSLKLVMDSLRYWVTSMHVDGFRFDLASTLARETGSVDKLSAFFDIIHQDPILSTVKLIAEPWDLGEGGYQVGNFPVLWTEWNGRYRDTLRHFWRGDAWAVPDMGYRLTGSSDLYADDGRHPQASINFITAHDGFTLRDLVSYEQKHNEANGEENRDGSNDNASWNCGVEGPASEEAIEALRRKQERNFWLSLMLSQGVPMITSGDEIGKTQLGNNNAFVQDNPISWLDWELDPEREALLSFARHMVGLRKRHPVFRRASFLKGERAGGSELKDIAWFHPAGREMNVDDWQTPSRATIALLLSGDALDWQDSDGNAILDDSFLILLNGSREAVTFVLPPGDPWGRRWSLRACTHDPGRADGSLYDAAQALELPANSAMLFKRIVPERGSYRPSLVPPGAEL